MRLTRKFQGLRLLALVLLVMQHQEQQQLPSASYWGPPVASAFILPAVPTPLPGLTHSGGPWGPPDPLLCGRPYRYVGAPDHHLPGGPPRAMISSPAQEKLALVGDGKERSGEYFLAEVGGFQRWMERGRFYDVNRIHQKEGGQLLLLRVLLLQQKEGPTLVGQPFLENIRVRHTEEAMTCFLVANMRAS